MISKHSLPIQIVLLFIVCPAFADQTAPPKGVSLPDLSRLNLDIDVKTFQNKTAFICFWDYNQRPSRRFVKELATLHEQLAQLNVPVLLIQTDPQSREPSKAYLDSYNIDWPCGTLANNVDSCFRDWSVSALPWPILTDMKQIQSMGFSLEQLSAALAAKDLSTLPLHTNWSFTFDTLYRLQDSEILKRIAPPFDPARIKYYQSTHPNASRPPDIFVFHWDNALKRWGESFGNPGDLRLTLSFVIGLKSYEYDISDDLLATKLPGDWIIRNEKPVAQKLSAFAPILSKALQRPALFELRNVEREAVVVSGSFNLKPLDEESRRPCVYLYTDPNDDRSMGGGGSFDSVAQLIRVIGDRIEIPMVDKTVKREDLALEYRTFHSSYLRSVTNPNEKRERIKILLHNVSAQTGLTFEFKRQEVDIWFLKTRDSGAVDKTLGMKKGYDNES
jgi:hypothetical protein